MIQGCLTPLKRLPGGIGLSSGSVEAIYISGACVAAGLCLTALHKESLYPSWIPPTERCHCLTNVDTGQLYPCLVTRVGIRTGLGLKLIVSVCGQEFKPAAA